MRPASAGAGRDPTLLAAVARDLASLLPPSIEPAWRARWDGRAASTAQLAAVATTDAYGQLLRALVEAADALGALATALGVSEQLHRAADRLVLVEPAADTAAAPDAADPVALAAVVRLRADAEDLAARGDNACAGRLCQLGAAAVPLLPPLLPAVAPEQLAQLALAGAGWSVVPPSLVGPLAALTQSVPDLATAPLAAVSVAARLVLAHRPALLRPGPGGALRQYLLAGRDGQLAEVWGDLASACSVLVLVPGTGTSIDHFGAAQDAGDATYEELRAMAGPDVAVVSWLGSAEPPDPVRAAWQGYAKKAAPLLHDFVDALPVAPGARVTVAGHSYGGLVAGMAVRDGLRPDALVGVAPAGFGPQVHDTGDLGGVPTYVLEGTHDLIHAEYLAQGLLQLMIGVAGDRLLGALGVGHLGDDPVGLPGAVRLASGDDGRYQPSFPPLSLAEHVGYFQPGSDTVRQIAAVAAGLPVQIAGGPGAARPPRPAPSGAEPGSGPAAACGSRPARRGRAARPER